MRLCVSSAAEHAGQVRLLVACQDVTLLCHSCRAQDAFLFPARQPPPSGSIIDLSVLHLQTSLQLPSMSSAPAAAEAEQHGAVRSLLLPCSLHLEAKLVRGVLTADVHSAALGLQASPGVYQGKFLVKARLACYLHAVPISYLGACMARLEHQPTLTQVITSRCTPHTLSEEVMRSAAWFETKPAVLNPCYWCRPQHPPGCLRCHCYPCCCCCCCC